MILYKYTSVDSAVRILEELRIKVSPPNQFNDPFEFTPRSRNTMTIEYLLDSLRDDPEHFRPVFEQMVRNESYPYSFTRFLSDLPQVLPIKFPEFYKLYEQELSKSDLNSLEQASEFVGVLCVSAVKDSILMWSHYAQNHTGVVIGIDTTHDSFQIGSPIDKVKYRNQRVVVDQLK